MIRNTPDKFNPGTNSDIGQRERKTKRTCTRCGFSYVYNADRNHPEHCPNCGGSGTSHLVRRI